MIQQAHPQSLKDKMNIETLHEFLGWCTVVNFGVLVVGAIKVLALRDWATKIHARMFQVDEEWVRRSYFMFFVYYKIAILVLNLVPYIALSIMM